MPKSESENAKNSEGPRAHEPTVKKSAVEEEVKPTEDFNPYDGPKPAKWQTQLEKEQAKEDKKEIEVDEAYDKHGQFLCLGTRIVVNGENRRVVKLTNKVATSIPDEATAENKEQTLDQVTLEHPLTEVTRY